MIDDSAKADTSSTNLHRYGQTHRQQLPNPPPTLRRPCEKTQVTSERNVAQKIGQHHQRHADPRDQRRQTGARRAHFGEPALAVDQQIVEPYVDRVRSQHDDHRRARIAHAFQKLLESAVHHERHDRPRQIAEIGPRLSDDLGRLPHPVHQSLQPQQQRQQDDSGRGIQHERILKQSGRAAQIALGVRLADQRRQPQRNAHAPEHEDDEHGSAERHAGQRQRAQPADHRVVGQLHDDLPDLRQHHRHGQRQVLPVLRQPIPEFSFPSETFHRSAKITRIPLCRKFPRRRTDRRTKIRRKSAGGMPESGSPPERNAPSSLAPLRTAMGKQEPQGPD